jgi:hypothetical protein
MMQALNEANESTASTNTTEPKIKEIVGDEKVEAKKDL